MIKLTNILTENYGGKGEMVLPPNHKAGLKVPKGGSCCANCKWWDKENQVCTSTYYTEWAGTNKIPYAANEYCTNWWEPANALSEMRINRPIPKFKSNDELANYMRKNPSFKKTLVDALWNTPEFKRDDDPSWNNVLSGWYNADVEQYSPYNQNDEIMLDDNNDNRAYISIDQEPLVYDSTDPKIHKIKLGYNTIYWQYY